MARGIDSNAPAAIAIVSMRMGSLLVARIRSMAGLFLEPSADQASGLAFGKPKDWRRAFANRRRNSAFALRTSADSNPP
jgi:hypothetical protein